MPTVLSLESEVSELRGRVASLENQLKVSDSVRQEYIAEIFQLKKQVLRPVSQPEAISDSFMGVPAFDEMLAKCRDILGLKGPDYTVGHTEDRLHNFRACSNFLGCSMEQVLAVFAYKHMAAIFAFIRAGGQSESEPIEGRIADVINYMLLFYAILKEKRGPAP